MPVYYVIGQWVRNPQGYQLYNIIKVIEGNFDDFDSIYNNQIAPITNQINASGAQYNLVIYVREPNNPFREWRNK